MNRNPVTDVTFAKTSADYLGSCIFRESCLAARYYTDERNLDGADLGLSATRRPFLAMAIIFSDCGLGK